MIEPTAYLVVGLVAVGMAVSFFAADRQSPTSRALSLFFGLLGGAFLLNVPGEGALSRTMALRLFAVAESLITASALEWGLRLSRTQVLAESDLRTGERLVRIGQAVAALYGVLGVVFVNLEGEVWKVVWHWGLLARPGFYLFAIPFFAPLAVGVFELAGILRVEFDPAERMRLLALAAASPFWIAGVAIPREWNPVSFAIGEVIFLFGAIRYHVVQGQRGQFLARFVSPELARIVRERGLAGTMQRSRVELSAVACDLRGFTAFAETGAPEEVMKLLEEYYAAVTAAVAEFAGSIKDFAGDGILALVGAPIPCPDHARRAIEMALTIRDRGDAVLAGWRRIGLELGLGVGAASGFATVGAIGTAGRLEYGAVGPVVNLASRLASRAEAGQVLAEPRVVGLAGSDGAFCFEKLEAVELKGFARPVTIYAVR